MKIYVELLNEGTPCWRPVDARDLGRGRFQIVEAAPEGEEWAFLSGDISRVQAARIPEWRRDGRLQKVPSVRLVCDDIDC